MKKIIHLWILILVCKVNIAQTRYFGNDPNDKKYFDSISLLIKKYPNDPELYFKRYKVSNRLTEDSRLHDPLADLNKTLLLDTTKAVYYYERGSYLESIKRDFLKALKDYDKAIELESDNPKYYYRRATLKYHDLEDKLGGCKDWTEGLKWKDKEPYSFGESMQEACVRGLEWCK